MRFDPAIMAGTWISGSSPKMTRYILKNRESRLGNFGGLWVSERFTVCEDNEGTSIANAEADEQSSVSCSHTENPKFPSLGSH
jgi:hypothetical protein